MRIAIEGGWVLRDDQPVAETLILDEGRIGTGVAAKHRFDAGGLLVLPGIVDIHGDAFERQMMPRPGVHFPLEVALHDTDRQLLANGITTAFHGITCSWEPGLRSVENFLALAHAIRRLRGGLGADTRVHLRFETFNLDWIEAAEGWLAEGLVDLLAFNDHTPDIHAGRASAKKAQKYCERTGLNQDAFQALVEQVYARAAQVPDGIRRLAAAAREHGVAMLSHDDETPQMRAFFHALGCRVAEFPKNEVTAQQARALGDLVVMGAPNVVRGGSHNGSAGAQPLVAAGLCQVLASDYYYPSQLLAAFKLANEGVLSLGRAWALVSANPARAAGLPDRGTLREGLRGDVILVDTQRYGIPRVVASFVAGQPVYLAEPQRLKETPAHSLVPLPS